MMIADYYAIR